MKLGHLPVKYCWSSPKIQSSPEMHPLKPITEIWKLIAWFGQDKTLKKESALPAWVHFPRIAFFTAWVFIGSTSFAEWTVLKVPTFESRWKFIRAKEFLLHLSWVFLARLWGQPYIPPGSWNPTTSPPGWLVAGWLGKDRLFQVDISRWNKFHQLCGFGSLGQTRSFSSSINQGGNFIFRWIYIKGTKTHTHTCHRILYNFFKRRPEFRRPDLG